MKKTTLLGIAVAVLVLGVAAVASARSNSPEAWMSESGNTAADLSMMTEGSSTDEMMTGSMSRMGSDHLSTMSDAMGADHVATMMPEMAAHHAEMMTDMTQLMSGGMMSGGVMSGTASEMMGSDPTMGMGIDHGGHHSP